MDNFDFFVLQDVLVLQYIIEPNKLVYFKYISSDQKLVCTAYAPDSCRFYNRDSALRFVDKIKNTFGIEFQIVRLCEV